MARSKNISSGKQDSKWRRVSKDMISHDDLAITLWKDKHGYWFIKYGTGTWFPVAYNRLKEAKLAAESNADIYL